MRAGRRDEALITAGLLLGLLAGGSGAAVLLGSEVDRLTVQSARLMDQIETLSGRLGAVDRGGSGWEVEVVEIVVDGPERASLAIAAQLKGLIRELVGRQLDEIDAVLLRSTLERTIEVDRREYAISVQTVYVTPRLRVFVQARAGRLTDG